MTDEIERQLLAEGSLTGFDSGSATKKAKGSGSRSVVSLGSGRSPLLSKIT